MDKKILDFCKIYNIIYLEIIDMGVLERFKYGDINKLPYKGLYSNLIGEDEQIINLFNTFSEDNEINTWRQGGLIALAYKKEAQLICMFFYNERKGIESVRYTQNIFKKWLDLFNIL